MPASTTVFLVRHGAVHNPADIYYGRRFDLPLSETGRREAAAAAAALRPLDVAAVYHSPLRRTTETAGILVAGGEVQAAPTPDELLLEVHTPYDGLTMAEMAARGWDMYGGNEPPFEQPADILARARRFLNRMAGRYPGQAVAAVTHGDVIAFTLLWLMERGVTPRNKEFLQAFGLPEEYPATGSITILTITGPDWPAQIRFDYHNPSQSA